MGSLPGVVILDKVSFHVNVKAIIDLKKKKFLRQITFAEIRHLPMEPITEDSPKYQSNHKTPTKLEIFLLRCNFHSVFLSVSQNEYGSPELFFRIILQRYAN